MGEQQQPKRKSGFLLLAIIVVVLIVLMTASLVGRLPPPGLKIVGMAPPTDHHTEGCFGCHRGMPTGAEIEDPDELLEGHPESDCANCHEGYVPPPSASSDPHDATDAPHNG